MFEKIKRLLSLSGSRHYISAKETVNAAKKEGLSVYDGSLNLDRGN